VLFGTGFSRLPHELILTFLEFFLVALGGITNPWRKNDYLRSGDPSVNYQWGKYLRPAILATNKEVYEIGINFLYGSNQFYFTQRVSSVPGMVNQPYEVAEFCAQPLLSPDDDQDVNRSEFMKNIVFLYSDSAAESLQRYHNPLEFSHEEWGLDVTWTFALLRHFEKMTFHLNTLEITILEAIEFINRLLEYETNNRGLSNPGDTYDIFTEEEKQSREHQWANIR